MNKFIKDIGILQIETTMKNLKKNGFDPCFLESADQVKDKVRELLKPGDVIGTGGSVTLDETGVMDLLRSGDYNFLDRYEEGLTSEDIRKIYVDCFNADVYLASANAVTMNGELYNVDGRSNRVAAICYGPKSVIIVAGVNKIVPDLKAAVQRVKHTAAPANCLRLKKNTYCAAAGVCQGMGENEMTSGCSSPDRICCNYLVSAKQS
jgi:L-lactate utilization protein LutB